MRTLPLRDAKAFLSAVVEAAERGDATTITKHQRLSAVVVPVEHARRLYPTECQSFAALLRDIPEAIEIERDQSPLREAGLRAAGCWTPTC